MIGRVLRFVRLPLLLLVLYAVGRFALGAMGVPYAPRGNAVFSMTGLALMSSCLFGALSRKVGGFGWGGTVLVGYAIGLSGQILIFAATWLSYAMGIETSYFLHWDALNLAEGQTLAMGAALTLRAQALLVGPSVSVVAALVGRALQALAPDPAEARS